MSPCEVTHALHPAILCPYRLFLLPPAGRSSLDPVVAVERDALNVKHSATAPDTSSKYSNPCALTTQVL
jgi:hypothetical protein